MPNNEKADVLGELLTPQASKWLHYWGCNMCRATRWSPCSNHWLFLHADNNCSCNCQKQATTLPPPSDQLETCYLRQCVLLLNHKLFLHTEDRRLIFCLVWIKPLQCKLPLQLRADQWANHLAILSDNNTSTCTHDPESKLRHDARSKPK